MLHQYDPVLALATSGLIMALLIGLALSRLGVLRGFWTGFWTGVFVRLFVGGAQGPGRGGGCLGRIIAFVVVVICAIVLARSCSALLASVQAVAPQLVSTWQARNQGPRMMSSMKATRYGSIFLLLFCMLMLGCSTASAAELLTSMCRGIGACDEPAPAPQDFDIVCDGSYGSTCTQKAVEQTLDVVLARAARRSGSRVRLWGLGSDVADTAILGEQQSSAASKRGPKARDAHEARFVLNAREFLLKAAEGFLASPGKRRSPIAEGLSRVAMSPPAGGAQRIVILVTDAREVSSFGDFECAPLPPQAYLLKALGRSKVLTQDSLSRVRVYFTFMTMAPVKGRPCPVTIARATQIRSLWTAALAGAGATAVSFEDGPVHLDEEQRATNQH